MSPLTQARRGSLHGYDVTDPTRLNPELGSETQLETLARELRSRDMGLLLDIVPNHMAASNDNPYWMDVLESGSASPFAHWFDIDWNHPKEALKNKVLLPILGAPFGRVVENGELVLAIDSHGFLVNYHENKLPLSIESYALILNHQLDSLESRLGSDDGAVLEIRAIIHDVDCLSSASKPQAASVDRESNDKQIAAAATARERLLWLYKNSADAKQFIDANLAAFNGRPGDPGSFTPFEKLLDQQHYRLSFWRLANEEINYRRFFTISDLVGIRVEDPRIFAETHALFKQWIAGSVVTGIRVDHIDGLRDPAGYLHRFQEHLTSTGATAGAAKPALKPFYIVVEKILAQGECLRKDWPVSGTTGYDFLSFLNGVFVKPEGVLELTNIYDHFIGSEVSFEDIVHKKKILVMETLLGGEMRSLGNMLGRLAEKDRYARDLPWHELANALVEVTASFPVYRTYIRDLHVSAMDKRCIRLALKDAEHRSPALNSTVFDFLRRVLMLEDAALTYPKQRADWLRFVMRWQQFTGPIMAKGCEDTALYVYNRLVSANEVGGDPSHSSVPLNEFHHRMQSRRIHSPHTLNATTTHDTKRAEDVRARIDVLSEMPAAWERRLILWSRWNEPHKTVWRGKWVPDRNEEVFLYQTLIGAWPLHAREVPSFRERLQNYMIKAGREAKAHTRWIRPDVEREKILSRFVKEILRPSSANRFLRDFLRFQRQTAFFGAMNSLSQLVIKICSPGVPDFYQGSELWDLRLVDPDNRGPIDFPLRTRLLETLNTAEEVEVAGLVRDLLDHWQDGRIKLYVTSKALNFRASHPRLFPEGDYLPLNLQGPDADSVCAFSRCYKEEWALVAVPRMLLGKIAAPDFPLGPTVWKDQTRLILPPGAPGRWKNVFTGETVSAPGRRYLDVQSLFQSFPVALIGNGARSNRAVNIAPFQSSSKIW